MPMEYENKFKSYQIVMQENMGHHEKSINYEDRGGRIPGEWHRLDLQAHRRKLSPGKGRDICMGQEHTEHQTTPEKKPLTAQRRGM